MDSCSKIFGDYLVRPQRVWGSGPIEYNKTELPTELPEELKIDPFLPLLEVDPFDPLVTITLSNKNQFASQNNMKEINKPTEKFNYPTLPITVDKIEALTDACIKVPVKYGLGSKVVPLSLEAGHFTHVDCSGFVRWCIYHALGQPSDFDLPDGSVNEHYNWVEKVGFKKSSFDAAHNKDNIVRIAFLDPQDTSEHIGHVMLIVNGHTLESHGRKGVDRRPWGSCSWMSVCEVYVLGVP